MVTDVMAQIAQSIAANDALLAETPMTSVRPMTRPSLGAMQQKNFIQQQGGMPPQGGAGGGGKMPPVYAGAVSPYQSLEAKNLLAGQVPTSPTGVNREAGNRSLRQKAREVDTAFQKRQAELLKQRASAVADTTARLIAPLVGEENADAIHSMVRMNPKLQDKVLDQFFKFKDHTTLQKQVQYVTGLPEGSEQRDLAMKILLKNNGTRLEVGADGSITLATGGEMPVTTGRTSTQSNMIFKDQDDIAKSTMSINSIAADFEEDFLRPISQIQGSIGRFADKWDIPDRFVDRVTGKPNMKRWGAEQQAFTRKAARRVFLHRKMITGVAGGEKEMQKIEDSLANAMTDSPMTFQINLQSELDDTYEMLNMKRIQAGQEPYDFSGEEYKLFPDLYRDKPTAPAVDNASGEVLEEW